ncbi:MAG: hypothetical protein ACH37Z_17145 [Anaerolineae bacterium]
MRRAGAYRPLSTLSVARFGARRLFFPTIFSSFAQNAERYRSAFLCGSPFCRPPGSPPAAAATAAAATAAAAMLQSPAMRRMLIDLADGTVTGLVFGLGGVGLARLRGLAPDQAASGLFVAGALVALAAMMWGILKRPSPPGLLARWPRPAATPSPFRQIWLDRAVTSGNLWLTAGLAMIALSFLLLLQP